MSTSDNDPPSPPPKKKRGNTSKRDAIVNRALMRDTQALELRNAGATYEQIHVQLRYGDARNACRAVRRRLAAIQDQCNETAALVRQQELLRIDRMLLGVWTKAKSGDVQAIGCVLRLMERRSAYLGLDAPKEAKITIPGLNVDVRTLSDEQLARFVSGDNSALLETSARPSAIGATAPSAAEGTYREPHKTN